MTLNLNSEERILLISVMEDAEFWCTDCDRNGATKSCDECPTYLNWEKAKQSIARKLDNSFPSFGRPKRTPEEQLIRAKMKRTMADIRVRKLELKT